MKSRFAVLSSLILTAAIVAAQSPNQQPGSISGSIFGYHSLAPEGAAQPATTFALMTADPLMNHSCPISVRAQHLSDGSLVKAGKAQQPKGIGQRLQLTLGNPKGQQLASASLVIHGFAPKGRIMQASANEGGNPDTTQTLTVSFSASANNTVSADVWVPGMTAVQAIEVKSVTYADGSMSNFAAGRACRVTPDGFMLISAR